MRQIIVSLLLGGLLLPSAYAAGDAAEGKQKAQTCMGCHGSPGYSNV